MEGVFENSLVLEEDDHSLKTNNIQVNNEVHSTKRSLLDGWLLRINDYEVKEFLGKGACGNVYRVIMSKENDSIAEKSFALKEIKICSNRIRGINDAESHNNNSDIFKEVEIMKDLKHKNIIQLHEVIVDPMDMIYIVMDYAEFGQVMKIDANDKNKYIYPRTGGVMGEAVAAKYFHELCEGMAYLHGKCIAHRDLKLDNLLLDRNLSLRIADFGISCTFRKESMALVTDTKGTPAFYAPEMCHPLNPRPFSAYKADVWAAGVCLWVFVFGTLPHNYSENLSLLISNGKPNCPHAVSKELAEVFDRCMSLDVNMRPNFKDCLELGFVTGTLSVGDSGNVERPNESKEKFSENKKYFCNLLEAKTLEAAAHAKQNAARSLVNLQNEREQREREGECKIDEKKRELEEYLREDEGTFDDLNPMKGVEAYEVSRQAEVVEKCGCLWFRFCS